MSKVVQAEHDTELVATDAITKFALSLFSLTLLRVLLEHYSSPDANGYFYPSSGIFLHIPLYYFSFFFTLTILLRFLTGVNFKLIFDYLLKVHFLILLPPILDLLFSRGKGFVMGYMITDPSSLITSYFKLLYSFNSSAITPGTRIVATGLIILVAYFIYKHTKKISRTLLGILLAYTIFYLYANIPTILLIFTSKNTLLSPHAQYASVLSTSILPETYNYFRNSLSSELLININNYLLASLFWILIVFQLTVIYILSQPTAKYILKKSVRTERIFNFILLSGIGMLLTGNSLAFLKNIANDIIIFAFWILIITGLVFETFINDLEDLSIDKISNKDRPLPNRTISPDNWKTLMIVLGLLTFIGLLTMSPVVSFFLFLLFALYFIYSAKPFRLKSHFISSSIIIGIATAFTSMAGFFLISPDQHIKAFSLKAFIVIFISQALLSTLKDIKDYEGDRMENIKTLPVIFGPKLAKRIIAILYFAVSMFVPIYLNIYAFLPLASILGAFSVFFICKNTFQEKKVFAIMFVYLLLLFIFSYLI